MRKAANEENEWFVESKLPAGATAGLEGALMRPDSQFESETLQFEDLMNGMNERLGVQTLLEFERKGHIKIKALLDEAQTKDVTKHVVSGFDRHRLDAYMQKIRLLADDAEDAELMQAASCIRTEEEAKALLHKWSEENDCLIPFLQVFNLHRGECAQAKGIQRVALSPSLGHIASDLLGVQGVKLYQSAVFHKAAGHGETSWHADLATAPFDTNHMVTCWIALTHVTTPEHSPLEFASGSHKDIALPYWYTEEGMENPSADPREYDVESHLPLRPGDSTWHHGWLYHAAPPNESHEDRIALALTFVSQDAYLLSDKRCRRRPETEDVESYRDWIEECPKGELAEHPFLPVTFSRSLPSSLLRESETQDQDEWNSVS